MKKNLNYLIFSILLIGILLKLFLTSSGNFIFHMDVARDFIDVREMVVLKNLRLIGPTSAIAGLFSGPLWYYLLSIPFLISLGNPYAGVIMMIIFWTIGGYFLLKIVSRFGTFPMLFAGSIWIGSNYINLATSYSFHPNMITFLTPVFIYCLEKYLKTKKLKYSILTFGLGGLFFQFEMNFGIFIPFIVLMSLLLTKNILLLKSRSFWLGFLFFGLTFIPQILFDLKHNFLMLNSVQNYLTDDRNQKFVLLHRITTIAKSFYDVILPTFQNSKILTNLILTLLPLSIFINTYKTKSTDRVNLSIMLAILMVPFIGYILLPVNVNPWHLGGVSATLIILSGFIFHQIWQYKLAGKLTAAVLLVLALISFINNINEFIQARAKPNPDQSSIVNEIAAIDYVYQYAKGKNFKVYAYLPSVYDYPYQYLFWWYGLKKYGYLPKDYAYLPNKPEYIRNKYAFQTGDYPDDSSLIFLIKEPDDLSRRELWENNFKHLPLISSDKVGPIEIEIKQDLTDYN